MGFIISVINKKGGVGKTATTVNLSILLALDGAKVLAVDLDDSRNLTDLFLTDYHHNIFEVFDNKHFDPRQAIYPAQCDAKLIPNLSVLPSSLELGNLVRHNKLPFPLLINQLNKVRASYDYILLDCPPGFTDPSSLSIYAADFLLIPTIYELDSLNGIADLFLIINGLKQEHTFRYQILRNKYHPSKTIMHSILNDTLHDFMQRDLVFKTLIEEDQAVTNAKAEQRPLLFYSPYCRAAKNYRALATEFKELINAEK